MFALAIIRQMFFSRVNDCFPFMGKPHGRTGTRVNKKEMFNAIRHFSSLKPQATRMSIMVFIKLNAYELEWNYTYQLNLSKHASDSPNDSLK